MRTSASVQPVLRDIVLLGGGHSHVGVLRRFAMKPVPGVRLTLICRDTHTPYSGMLPGYVAGHYDYDEVHIDLRRLAAYAGARFFRDEAIGLDRQQQQVICSQRPPVPYDLLSINIGSSPKLSVEGADRFAVPVKPIRGFNERWLSLLQRIKDHKGTLTIAVVGSGAGGVELTLAMQHRLKQEFRALGRDPRQIEFHLFDAAESLLPTHNRWVKNAFGNILDDRGVALHLGDAVTRISANQLHTARGATLAVDEVLWVTNAGGPSWLADTGLALDESGFIRVRDTLQTETDEHIFAAGDIAQMIHHPREKAGVIAVRQGPALAENLKRAATDSPLRTFRPQSRWLALISTGDQYAVASRGIIGFRGQWVWRWKDLIDRRFMARFNDLPPMEERVDAPDLSAAASDEDAQQAISALAMRCGGCGAKVGSSTLSRALANLKPVQRNDILVGLHAPDDAAVLAVPPGKAVVQTVDFFRTFIDDPYLFGRIAANHALGDIFAMGAEAQSATAVATVPYGTESKTEDVLVQMMGGAVEVLNAAGCALVGGHTGEGQELALGFAVNGLIEPDRILSKDGLKTGDALILTKPLGTGTLFAAYPQLKARGRWIDAALEQMQVSSLRASQCLREYGVSACTDVTGFGLLGHLVEMTKPSGVDAELTLSELPLLEGAEETMAQGILSSLQPANIRLRRAIRNQAEMTGHPRYSALFDPQTAGGLLAGVPGEQAQACVQALRDLGYRHARIIGRIIERSDADEPILLTE